jgi:SAM-dependent methyltransferase
MPELGSKEIDADRLRWEGYIRGQFAGEHPLEVMRRTWAFHEPLYGRIQAALGRPARVIEVGTGSGVNAAWFALNRHEVLGIDFSPAIIEFARGITRQLAIDLKLEVADARDLSDFHGSADVVFSTGVIEHWEPTGVIEALREQSRCAPIVVAEIPTTYTALTGTPTDEHFYGVGELKRMFADAGLTDVCSFGYGNPGTRGGRFVEGYFPPRALRLLRHRAGRLCMAIGCIGIRRETVS